MKTTTYPGIDYGRTTSTNRNGEFHYGVISIHSVSQAWCESSEPFYGHPETVECPECGKTLNVPNSKWGDSCACHDCNDLVFEIELPDFAEPISWFIDDKEYQAECGEMGEIVITRSPYFMRAQFCSPCFPGAGNCDTECEDGPKTLCFSHDWFEDGKAPYRVYRCSDGSEVLPE